MKSYGVNLEEASAAAQKDDGDGKRGWSRWEERKQRTGERKGYDI